MPSKRKIAQRRAARDRTKAKESKPTTNSKYARKLRAGPGPNSPFYLPGDSTNAQR